MCETVVLLLHFSCFFKALLSYIVLQELHEGALGLAESLDHQTLGLVRLKEAVGIGGLSLVHSFFSI